MWRVGAAATRGILLTEQNVGFSLDLTDRVYVLQEGRFRVPRAPTAEISRRSQHIRRGGARAPPRDDRPTRGSDGASGGEPRSPAAA
jgi:hypothetical protein